MGGVGLTFEELVLSLLSGFDYWLFSLLPNCYIYVLSRDLLKSLLNSGSTNKDTYLKVVF